MTCAWVNRVSFNPGLISIAIGKDRTTWKNIKKTKVFGISLCSDEENVLASVAGGYSGKDFDKIKALKELGFKIYKAKEIDVLMVEAALNLECKLVGELDAGDHTLFIGEVISGKSSEKNPLLYSQGKYWSIGKQVLKPNTKELERIKKIVEKNKRN